MWRLGTNHVKPTGEQCRLYVRLPVQWLPCMSSPVDRACSGCDQGQWRHIFPCSTCPGPWDGAGRTAGPNQSRWPLSRSQLWTGHWCISVNFQLKETNQCTQVSSLITQKCIIFSYACWHSGWHVLICSPSVSISTIQHKIENLYSLSCSMNGT